VGRPLSQNEIQNREIGRPGSEAATMLVLGVVNC